MNGIAAATTVLDEASGWSRGLRVAAGGQGLVAHAGVVLPRLLADMIAALITGASCLSDVKALTRQVKEPSVAGHYKGGIGYHPLTAWCSNIGDHLAIMQRPGNAGSFTAEDHVAVLDGALAQIPAAHRRDILVAIDGAGASHAVIDHLTRLNTAKEHGRRGRRVEYSIGWPVDQRTRAGIEQLPETAWTARLAADGRVVPGEQVAGLTGLLRHGPEGDRLEGWPADLRVIVNRTPRSATEQAALGEDAEWRHGAFATNTVSGQIQWLDARHRTQTHVEDKIKELKAMGAEKLPTADQGRNAAWLQLAALAVTLTAWLRHLALDGDLALAEPKTLRYRLLNIPARLVRHARSRILKIPHGWAWADDLVNAWDRLQALHPG